MTQRSRAWLMDVGTDQRLAAGAQHVVEYLVDPQPLPVPRTPSHCAGLIIWRERMIPVIDFARPAGDDGPARRAVILAYQDAPGQALRYGALRITAAPAEVWVSDDMAGAPERMPDAFRPLARACIVHNDRVVPILDVKRLFGSPMPDASDVAAEATDRGRDSVRFSPGAAGDRPAPNAVPVTEQASDADTNADDYDHWAAATLAASAGDAGTADILGHERGGDPALDEPSSPEPLDLELGVEFDVSDAAAAVPEPMGPAAPPLGIDIEVDMVSVSMLESEPEPALEPVEAAVPDTGDDQVAADEAQHAAPAMTALDIDAATQPAPATTETRPRLAGSGTLQSFARLRAIEGGLGNRARTPRRWRRGVLITGLVVAIAAGAIWALQYYLVGAPAPGPVMVAHDPAPGGVQPVSVPSTPVQPPR